MQLEKNNVVHISLVCNLLLVFLKGVTGLLANSNALVADAFHSMTDVIAFLINYRALKTREFCEEMDEGETNEVNSRRIAEIETKATYCAGVFLLAIGLGIYLYNSALLILGRYERPDSITLIIAFVALAVYSLLYKYFGSPDNAIAHECTIPTRNANLQNKLNLVSGTVVVIGIIGSMLGFYFMDEFAAVVVGSIVIGLGAKWTIENNKKSGTGGRNIKRANDHDNTFSPKNPTSI